MSVTADSPYLHDLDRNDANFVPLTPSSLIKRAARIFPDYPSVIHGDVKFTWGQTYTRCRRLASALTKRGIGLNDSVSVIASNIPAMYECHFGVPMIGAVLNTINIRLDAAAVAFILDHAEAKFLLVSGDFLELARQSLALSKVQPPMIVIDEEGCDPNSAYERFLAEGDPEFEWKPPADEWQAISLSYTSGTTGNPKGVVTHHRGAYLNALCNALQWDMGPHPRYLWTLPMFHCNGWCFPWTLAAVAGVSICLRRVSAKGIYDAIADHGANHLCAAPTVLTFIINAKKDEVRDKPHLVKVMTAGAAPPAAIIAAMTEKGFAIEHVYGLTEVYGPAASCVWKDEWNDLPLTERARLKARQGVPYPVEEDVQVLDPNTMEAVPWDGETMGEIMFRGNVVMKGYFKNPAATKEAFAGGWFHSGDLGVMHPDGYIQLKDRSKDIIISGGENISSVEVEEVLYRHPAVLEAAVVSRPDEKWGETPCAFVTVRDGVTVTEQDIIAFCHEHLAKFKCPRTVVFTSLPKTSTGKIQKFQLRKAAEEMNQRKG
ncbi:acyl-CoA synthetase [Paramagnetospirillum kuznetsovii]|uniref:3-methylmercaptopropionyl-CoA ligase n=1 Tax=Paramagnetospirillum kuznetsovii TaxID=2053833 RepID=A0A364NWR3_9PROT|nr:acyl-CoA synthetase [Paramagnetospirillum kuznetsovii]RAU21420.1 acyl-CoA synthetase [Paramagnetospirillum kuznetsovii]